MALARQVSSSNVSRDGGMAPSLARALTTSTLPTLATSEYLAVCWQNAGALTSASRLLRAANTRAKTFTKIAFIQDQEDLQEEQEAVRLEEVMARVREVKAGAEVKLEEVKAGQEGRRNVVGLMVKQGNVTEL